MQQNNQISGLIEFVQKATKLGKYNLNTGNGLANAIKTGERGLFEDEPKDIDYLEKHIEELFFRQQDLNLSPQSQAVYFTRIKRAIDDYKKYGTDAKAIYSWSPKLRSKKTTSNKKTTIEIANEETSNNNPNQTTSYKNEEITREVGGVKINTLSWRLRPGVMIKIELPEDLTEADVNKLKALLNIELGIGL